MIKHRQTPLSAIKQTHISEKTSSCWMFLFVEGHVFMAEQVSQCLLSPHMGTFANIGEGIFSSKKTDKPTGDNW
jgi:hypothetical protein